MRQRQVIERHDTPPAAVWEMWTTVAGWHQELDNLGRRLEDALR